MEPMGRRRVLAGLGAFGAWSMVDVPLHAARPKPGFFKRLAQPIGLQLYSLGNDISRDLDAAFMQVAAIGYRDIQLPGLYGMKPAELRKATDAAGLSISSVHLPLTSSAPGSGLTLASPPAQIVDTLGLLGAKAVTAPIMLFPDGMKFNATESFQVTISRAMATAGEDVWKRTAALLNAHALALKPLGIRTAYHNHNLEFAPVGGTTGWAILMKEMDPALVYVEADIGWVAAAGLDPVAFLNAHKGRITHLHVKDLQPSTVVNFELKMDPTEVGSGQQDWKRILPAAYAAGCRHFYVEQEPPFAMPRMDAVRKSYDFMNALVA